MDILSLLIGVALGGLIGWLLGKRGAATKGISTDELEATYIH